MFIHPIMAVLNECNNGMLDAFQARPSFLGLLSKSQCTMGEDEKALRHTINTNKKKTASMSNFYCSWW